MDGTAACGAKGVGFQGATGMCMDKWVKNGYRNVKKISPPFRGGGGVKTEIFHFRGLPPPHLEIFHLPKVKYFS